MVSGKGDSEIGNHETRVGKEKNAHVPRGKWRGSVALKEDDRLYCQ